MNLIETVKTGDLDTLKSLLEDEGVILNDEDKSTALMYAAEYGNLKMVKYLVIFLLNKLVKN